MMMSCHKNGKYTKIKGTTTDDSLLSTALIPDDDFLGNEACATCHTVQFNDWQGSHHDKAMQIASRATILAKFEGESFNSQGINSHFFTKNSEFYVNTEGPDGNYHDYKIIYTFGLTPLQQYIVQFPDGKYQCLRTAWDTKNNKWFDLYPEFKIVHSEWLHWSKGGLNWNNMCADCHATNVRENYDETQDSYNTKFSILNVSCEACHGPGKKHIDQVKKLGSAYNSEQTYMQMTAKISSEQLVDQCARCHMRREQFSENYNYQGTLLDHYFPQLIESPIYYPDGQILDEDYVYGSFIQSKMYKNDVSCKDCHDSHSLKLKYEGNALCYQCHEPKTYNNVDHHFHEGIDEATQCVNCHMTGRTYMGNDYRRDHSFRIPRPDLSIKYDTPNACNQCHTDKNNDWAWQAFKQFYGVPDYNHFSEQLAAGIAGEVNGHIGLYELAKDHTQPDIARASAIKALQNYNMQNNIDDFIAYLNDPSTLVRGATIDVLSEVNSTDFLNYLLPKLNDHKRTIRVKAFYALGYIKENDIPETYKAPYKKAKKEFWSYIKINSDFSGGQAKKGSYYQKQGDLIKAKEAYLKALNIDNQNNMIRSNLANVYYNLGEKNNAEEAFREVIKQEPDFGLTYYSLALLLAELERTEDAIIEMKEAYRLIPSHKKIIYNLSLLYDKNKNFKEAEKVLISGIKLYPKNEELLYALAFHYSNQSQKQKGLAIINKLIKISPQNSHYKSLMDKIKQIQ